MASIDDRNMTNQFKGLEAQLSEVHDEIKLQRAQLIGLASMMMLLGLGLYKMAKVIA